MEMRNNLGRAFNAVVRNERHVLSAQVQRLQLSSPESAIYENRQRLDELGLRSQRALRQHTRLLRSRLTGLEAKLVALSPSDVLGRGYAVVTNAKGTAVSRAAQVSADEKLQVRVRDGSFGVKVEGS
jgi:exodeoxyribonuclease VII large subunit